jgi:hypothetical protein
MQGDKWDQASRFIYDIRTLDELRRETKRVATRLDLPVHDFARYVIRRWYNFHTHQITLDIIMAHPRTRPEIDPYHHNVDFYVDREGFDLKLTPLPRGFAHNIGYARAYPGKLASWLYEHQSKQGRFHTANRLFVVIYDTMATDRVWELRRDFTRLGRAIHTFLDAPHWISVKFADHEGKQHRPLTGVIFCVRE